MPTPEAGRDGRGGLGDGRPAAAGPPRSGATRLGRLLAGGARRIPALPRPLSGWTVGPRPARPAAETFRAVGADAGAVRAAAPAPDGIDGADLAAPRESVAGPRATGERPRGRAGPGPHGARRAAPVGPVPRDYRRTASTRPGAPELLDLLVDRLVDYKAGVPVHRPDELPDAVAAALADGLPAAS